MTTAHRPTWRSAQGGPNQGGNRVIVPTRQYSSKDLPGQLVMKERTLGQGSESDIAERDFRADLRQREQTFQDQKAQGVEKPTTDGVVNKLLQARTYEEWQRMELQEEREKGRRFLEGNHQESKEEIGLGQIAEQDSDEEEALRLLEENSKPMKKKRIEQTQDEAEDEDSDTSETPFPQDADYKYSSEEEDEAESDSDDDAELMREYERIKREKEEEQQRKEQARAEEERREREAALLQGNPLTSLKTSHAYSLKRKWHEETVFKNQARNDKKEEKRRFINDTVRSDFHRKFLNKYVH